VCDLASNEVKLLLVFVVGVINTFLLSFFFYSIMSRYGSEVFFLVSMLISRSMMGFISLRA
jgi:hypothetical protein